MKETEENKSSEKPDFDKLYPGTPLNDNAHRRVEGFVWGCDKIWNDYVSPLQKELSELKEWFQAEKESSRLAHEVMRTAEQRGIEKGKEERDSLKSELTEAKTGINIASNLIIALNEYLNSISGRDITFSKSSSQKVDELSNQFEAFLNKTPGDDLSLDKK